MAVHMLVMHYQYSNTSTANMKYKHIFPSDTLFSYLVHGSDGSKIGGQV